MKKSILDGASFQPAESGVSVEGTLEVKKKAGTDGSYDQLTIAFGEESEKEQNTTRQNEPKYTQPIDEPYRADRTPDSEIPQPSISTFLDLPIIHLQNPEPIVYENAPRRALPLDQYHVGNKKKLQEFKSFNALSEIFTLEDTPENRQKMLGLQEDLYQKYLAGLSFPDMLNSYLALLKIINKVGIVMQGAGSRNTLHEFFTQTFGDVFIIHHDVTEQEIIFSRGFLNKGQAQRNTMAQEQKKDYDYWIGLMQSIFFDLSNYVASRNYCEHEGSYQSERLRTVLESEQGELQNLAQELLEAIKTQRRFGLRSSFYQDDLFHDETDGWVMMHPFEFEKPKVGTLAAIFLTSHDAVMKTGISAKRLSTYRHEAVETNVDVAAFDSKLSWHLALDGELYIGAAQSRVAVREVFKRLENEPLYDLLRLSFIARVHDLVVPAGGVKRLPANRKLSDFIKRLASGEATEEEFRTVIKTFIVQRVKYINDPDQIKSDEIKEQTKRKGVKVGVKPLAGTTYDLPEGHRRTAYAEANFLEKEGYPITELDTTGTLGYRKPFDMPLYTYTRVIPEQKTESDQE